MAVPPPIAIRRSSSMTKLDHVREDNGDTEVEALSARAPIEVDDGDEDVDSDVDASPSPQATTSGGHRHTVVSASLVHGVLTCRRRGVL